MKIRERAGLGPRYGRTTGLLLACMAWAMAPPAMAVDHSGWDALLQRYVDDAGRVAYRRLAAESDAVLAGYLASLAIAAPEALPPKEQLAFWINAYNATIVAGVLQGYSAENVLKRALFFKSYSRPIAGVDRTPDDIEHGVIRRQFRDPRIHFAVVCAATSCPLLRQEAYVGERLDEQLDDQGRRFLNDPTRNRIDAGSGQVVLSPIFKWFAEDFSAAGRRLADVLQPYLSAEQVRLLETAEVRYQDYDWRLNAQPGQRP